MWRIITLPVMDIDELRGGGMRAKRNNLLKFVLSSLEHLSPEWIEK
jgi:hypothetical protein